MFSCRFDYLRTGFYQDVFLVAIGTGGWGVIFEKFVDLFYVSQFEFCTPTLPKPFNDLTLQDYGLIKSTIFD